MVAPGSWMGPRSGGGWLRVGGRVMGSSTHDSLLAGEGQPSPARSEWARDLSQSCPRPPSSPGSPGPAASGFPLAPPSPAPPGGGRPGAQAQKELRVRGCGRSGAEAAVSLLGSPLLFVAAWASPTPFLHGERGGGGGGGRKPQRSAPSAGDTERRFFRSAGWWEPGVRRSAWRRCEPCN